MTLDEGTIDETSLEELLEAASVATNGSVHGPIPAKVQAYNPDTQRATVQPIVAVLHEGAVVPWPVMADVLVAFPHWSGGSITWPLDVGSYVDLVPQDVDIGAWKASGTEGQLPASSRSCSWADVIAIPCPRPGGSPLPTTAWSALGPVIAGQHIFLVSSAATDFVALASKVMQELNALIIWASTHVHTCAAPGAPSSVPTVLPSEPGSVASAKVHAE
jgi:hypothetical protein